MKAIAVARQHRAFPEGIGELRQVAHGIGVRWARVQATSRGSWGQGPIQQRSAAWSQGPNQHRNAAPLRRRRAVDTSPEAVEIGTLPPCAHAITLKWFQANKQTNKQTNKVATSLPSSSSSVAMRLWLEFEYPLCLLCFALYEPVPIKARAMPLFSVPHHGLAAI